jgi:hypothetical protein
MYSNNITTMQYFTEFNQTNYKSINNRLSRSLGVKCQNGRCFVSAMDDKFINAKCQLSQFSGYAAQRMLWPPVAMQASACYGLLWLCSPAHAMASSLTRFLDHTQRRATVSRTTLDEWSARRRDLYLTTHNRQHIHAPGGIRTHDHSRRAAVDLRFRPRGHWDRHIQALIRCSYQVPVIYGSYQTYSYV